MTDFAVIQTRFETIPEDVLISAMTGPGEMTHPDATQSIRRHRGILWDRFAEPQATAVCQALTKEGYSVACVESDDLPRLDEPRIVRWFEFDENEIRIPQGIRGQTVPIPWESLLVLSLGRVAEVSKHQLPSRPNVIASSATSAAMSIAHDVQPRYGKRSKLIEVLDLIGLDANGTAHYIRLPSNELAFGRIMGEGTNLTRFERFLVVVEYCVHHAPDAIVSPATRKALVDREPSAIEIDGDGLQAIQDEVIDSRNRWLLYLALHSKRPKAQSEDETSTGTEADD